MVVLPVMVALIFAAVPVHDVVPEPLTRPRPAGLAVAPAPPAPERPRPAIVRRSVESRPAPSSGRRATSGVPADRQVERSVRAAVPAASIALPSTPLLPPAVTAAPRPRLVGFPLVVVRTPAPSRATTVTAVALSPEARTQAP
jgi:hypothetical protein